MKKETVFGMDFDKERPKLKKNKEYFLSLKNDEEVKSNISLKEKKAQIPNLPKGLLPIGMNK